MLPVSQSFLDGLTGSFAGALQVDAWYGGELVLSAITVESAEITLDAAQLIQGQATLTLAANDGSLIPRTPDAPLGCWGSELHVRAGLAIPGGPPELVSVGWYRIDTFDAELFWLPDLGQVGSRVTVTCSDRMAGVDDARFLSPEQPAGLGSTLAEIRRLAIGAGLIVADLTGIADAPIPSTVTYSDSRAQAIADLADNLGAIARMDAHGALGLVPAEPSGDPVWSATSVPARAGAPLLGHTWHGDRAGIYNAVVSTGTSDDGTPMQGSAVETDGPLVWGGPFGQVPYKHGANLAGAQSAVDADAATILRRLVSQRTASVPVTLPGNPALRPGDIIAVEIPGTNGAPPRTISGPITSLTLPLPPATMTATIAASTDTLWGGNVTTVAGLVDSLSLPQQLAAAAVASADPTLTGVVKSVGPATGVATVSIGGGAAQQAVCVSAVPPVGATVLVARVGGTLYLLGQVLSALTAQLQPPPKPPVTGTTVFPAVASSTWRAGWLSAAETANDVLQGDDGLGPLTGVWWHGGRLVPTLTGSTITGGSVWLARAPGGTPGPAVVRLCRVLGDAPPDTAPPIADAYDGLTLAEGDAGWQALPLALAQTLAQTGGSIGVRPAAPYVRYLGLAGSGQAGALRINWTRS